MSAYRQPDDGRRCAECDGPMRGCMSASSAIDGAWHTGWCCSLKCCDARADALKAAQWKPPTHLGMR
jgi:hypothetical protein